LYLAVTQEELVNREWHAQHTMPPSATDKQRIAWHLEHITHCACRPFPAGLLSRLSEAEKRQIASLSGKPSAAKA